MSEAKKIRVSTMTPPKYITTRCPLSLRIFTSSTTTSSMTTELTTVLEVVVLLVGLKIEDSDAMLEVLETG